MLETLSDASCASFPWLHVAALGPLRNLPDVTLARVDDRAWVRWQVGNERVLQQILPLPDAVLFIYRDAHWYRFGHQLPAFDVPVSAEYQPLHQVLTPSSFQTQGPANLKCEPTMLVIVSDDRERPTTAALCALGPLIHWIERVPTARLKGIQAAHCENQVLLLGDRIPLLPESARFWGSEVLIPLGYRPDPFLPERALRDVLAASEDQVILWDRDGVERIDRRAFAPLSRAGVRLVAQLGAKVAQESA
jgi:hypothetical protein